MFVPEAVYAVVLRSFSASRASPLQYLLFAVWATLPQPEPIRAIPHYVIRLSDFRDLLVAPSAYGAPLYVKKKNLEAPAVPTRRLLISETRRLWRIVPQTREISQGAYLGKQGLCLATSCITISVSINRGAWLRLREISTLYWVPVSRIVLCQ